MLDDNGFEKFESNDFPLAYLITFCSYGTWLHGDDRHSVGRNGKNVFGRPDIAPNSSLRLVMSGEMRQPPVIFKREHRKSIESAICELSELRNYDLLAVQARTNHVHSVISMPARPERIANNLKAHATKRLREHGYFLNGSKVWARGRSRRYLWKPQHVERAIHYTLYEQGHRPFEIDGS
jgi:REP element-mobilizing transposase RayT